MRNNLIHIPGIILFTLIFSAGCEEDFPNQITLECKLVDETGEQRSVFQESDSLIFEFYLSNYSDAEATYLRPCGEFGSYLNVYRQDTEGSYEYYGRPEYYCVMVAIYEKISTGEIIRLGRIPWNSDHGWPDKKPGKYYVGDTMSLRINSTTLTYVKRIYFQIL